MDQYAPSDEDKENEFKDYPDGMKYISANYPNFKAYILLVSDPSRVYVGTSSSNYNNATEGKRIFAMAKQENFIAAINGGEFADDGGVGNGARPMGLTYSKGECVWNDGNDRTFIGIDKNNRLVVAESMTKKTADELEIRDAVSFQKGNVLISTENGETNAYYKPWNTGAAQRTAIGQRADGTFIFVVTDGRTASSIGATYDEMINIMLSYGAVTAALLDGGSSSMMYYENYFDKYDIDKSKLDEYQLQGLTNRYKAFTPPRRIPTYFCVSR
jgi:exopolysaccharide biosynthesis protein